MYYTTLIPYLFLNWTETVELDGKLDLAVHQGWPPAGEAQLQSVPSTYTEYMYTALLAVQVHYLIKEKLH